MSQAGTVVVTSGTERTVTYLVPREDGIGKPRTEDLPEAAGEPTAVTTVGDTVVTLDSATGALAVLGGGTASVPEDAVLQQAGPASDAVLVASRGSLMSVDLTSGEASVLAEGLNGQPAEPVRLGACQYAAWSGGLGHVAVRCGDDEATVSDLGGKGRTLSLRVNRGEIVLNDGTTGTVWDVEDLQPQRIDNWNAFTASTKVEEEDKENQEQSNGDRRPPKAEPDRYGARPGRTTVLHPLDNDSAPDGRLLSIVQVDDPTGGARAEISPDGQTIVLSLPDDARSTSFEYHINDGRDTSAHATVTVAVRGASDNSAPQPRSGYKPRVWRVPAAGSLSVPVLADWRDDSDGDAVVLDSATAVGGDVSGAVARTTSDGRVRFTAPRDGGEPVQVAYTVTDGRSAPVRRTMTFQVQDKLDQEAFAATAEPDVVRGEVGQPIKIRPLLNDLPGSDPADPDAELALGGKLPGQGGAVVKTDTENGVITFTGSKAGTFFLDYDAAYGNAPLDGSTVRVDVQPARGDRDPIAMPDALTVYGQSAAIVDVLANDLDPAGGLLAVQRAVADDPGQLDVAIIDGRWLRISARQGSLAPNPQLVSYTISNGTRSGVEGEVSVSLRPVPKDNSPITAADRVDGACRHLGDRAGARQRPLAVRRPALPARRRRRGSPGGARGRRADRREGGRGPGLRHRPHGALRRARRPRGARQLHHPLRRGQHHRADLPGSADRRRDAGRRPQHRARAADAGVAGRLGRHGQGPPARQRGRPRRRPGHHRGHHLRPPQGPPALLRRQLPRVPGLSRARRAPTSSSTPSWTPREGSPPPRCASSSCPWRSRRARWRSTTS